MMSFVPYCHSVSIFDVDIEFFLRLNIKTLLVDLDNTLDSYKAKEPSQKVIDFKKKLDENNITLIIISNNKEQRVKPYADALSIKYLFSTRKPFPKKLNKFLEKEGILKEEAMVVGDQLLTDVMLGNLANIKVMLTEKIVSEDQWTTKFNRLIDRPLRKCLRKKCKLVNWKEKL